MKKKNYAIKSSLQSRKFAHCYFGNKIVENRQYTLLYLLINKNKLWQFIIQIKTIQTTSMKQGTVGYKLWRINSITNYTQKMMNLHSSQTG